MSQRPPVSVCILVFDAVEVLDFAGPYEVFTTASRVHGKRNPGAAALFDVACVSRDGQPIQARAGLRVLPEHSFADHPRCDLLLVPGGVVDASMACPQTLDWIARTAAQAQITASVCTGAFLLAASGLVRTGRVTTHWEDTTDLQTRFPALTVCDDPRWIFGLRQSLDTVGAFLGPTLAVAFMLLWNDNFRAVFWVATVPAFMCVALLVWGVKEPDQPITTKRSNPISRANLARLSPAYWWVVGVGAIFTLARFSEAFLVLRAQQGGLALAWTPLVLIGMNIVYASCAYPFGKLADKVRHTWLLGWGLLLLIGADVLLAYSNSGLVFWAGVALWGLHMAMTQGLLAAMVADTAPADLRGTGYGFFNLLSGAAMLIASGLAGWLWQGWGAQLTFVAGIGFAALALLLLMLQPRGLAR